MADCEVQYGDSPIESTYQDQLDVAWCDISKETVAMSPDSVAAQILTQSGREALTLVL